MSTIVVRLVSPAGRSRLNVPATATLSELQEQIKTHVGVEPSGQHLALDRAGTRMVSGGPSTALAQLGIVNGTEVHLVGAKEATIAPQILTKQMVPVEPKDGDKKEEANDPKAAGGASSSGAASSSGGAPSGKPPPAPGSTGGAAAAAKAAADKAKGPEEKKGPAHVAFDAFIKKQRYETGNLPGALRYTPKPLEKGRMTKLPNSVTLGFQPYRHVDHLEYMNTAELGDFVKYWRNSLDMITQRCGIMYGYFREDKNFEEGCRAVLEGIYEPPQTPVGDAVTMLDDPKKEIVTKITDRLGLEPIGWIFTGLPREEFLTSSDVSQIARLQMEHLTTSHFTKFPLSKFVTCVIRPDPEQEGRPTPNVFMVSDQCVAMMRDDLLGDSPDPKYCILKEQGKNMLMPAVLESGKQTKKFDPDWFLVRVSDGVPKKVRSMFKHATFPREHRQPPQKRDDVKNYFRKVNSSEPSWSRFADFHLVLYLAQEFDIDTALDICDCIRDRKEISAGTMEMIQALTA